MDYTIDRYADTLGSSAYSAQADRIKDRASGISSDSTYEELEDAAKQFEAYFLETIIKEFKKSVDDMKEDEGDAFASQTTDLFMDQTISEIAATMVDLHAQRLTKDLADQMARNMGITPPDEKTNTETNTGSASAVS